MDSGVGAATAPGRDGHYHFFCMLKRAPAFMGAFFAAYRNLEKRAYASFFAKTAWISSNTGKAGIDPRRETVIDAAAVAN